MLGTVPKRRIFTVSEISRQIKSVLEERIGDILVQGEVSNASCSGEHLYFTLKDDSAILPAAMFYKANRGVKFKIENGLQVICLGKISAYGPHGKYQIIVEAIEPKGIGSLQLALEQLKEKLQKEGLFAQEHKRKIPYLPGRIGIVTSSQGAAIKDILKVLDRRFSDCQIIINHAQVQGEGAKEQISESIGEFNLYNEALPLQERIEVLIVGRGGGSIEDLWAFNEEVVARAIYNSKIPVISAVGHERDYTIADLVADLRAPTPSVAAELVLPRKEDLIARLKELTVSLENCFSQMVSGFSQDLEGLVYRLRLGIENIFKLNIAEFQSSQKKLAILNPLLLLEQHKAKILDSARQIHLRAIDFLKFRQAEFNAALEKLSGLSPLNILSRGYSITFKMPAGKSIRDVNSLRIGDTLKTKLHNGEFLSRVTEVKTNG